MLPKTILLLLLTTARVGAQQLCLPDCSTGICTFNFNVKLTAGQLGYFEVAGCEGVNPTLGLEIGVTHRFVQAQYENYYHPLGFSYFPDGAHDNVDELEPGIPPPGSGSTCDGDMTCPAPMYFLNGEYLGKYSNDPNVLPVTTGEDNFGLDDYEPLFFYPFSQWLEKGWFTVNLRFDESYDKDIFYFCHIHQFMTGRIKLLSGGVPVQPDEDLPEIPYEYDMPSEYDQLCGSFGLDDFRLPNSQCPAQFICDHPDESTPLGQFADCIESQNCQMFSAMTTGVSAKSEIALFLHQMIPHHENAINMAKTLLSSGDLDDCAVYDEDNPKCAMYDIALSIVNGQNFQIQQMKGLLDSYGFPETDDCVVEVDTTVVS